MSIPKSLVRLILDRDDGICVHCGGSRVLNDPANLVWGLVVRDRIGRSGFEQEHYDVLTKPWASVIGKVHPDD